MIVSKTTTHILLPRCQKIVPNMSAEIKVKERRTRLYPGLRQYVKFCFQRRYVNCPHKVRQYWVGNSRSFVPSAGILSSLTISLLHLLQTFSHVMLMHKLHTSLRITKCIFQGVQVMWFTAQARILNKDRQSLSRVVALVPHQ